MIFWLVLLGFLISLSLEIKYYFKNKKKETSNTSYSRYYSYHYDDDYIPVPCIFMIIFGIVLAIMLLILMHIGLDNNAYLARLEQEKISLEYQLDRSNSINDLTVNENIELMTNVTNFNKNIVNGKAKRNNFWVGIFYSSAYNKIDVIDLNNFKNP